MESNLAKSPSILIDGFNVLKKEGTGINSYAHTLARTLGDCGVEVSMYFGQKTDTAPFDLPIGLANQVFGSHRSRPGRLSTLVSQLLFLMRGRFGMRRNIPAAEVVDDGVEMQALDPPLPTTGAYL